MRYDSSIEIRHTDKKRYTKVHYIKNFTKVNVCFFTHWIYNKVYDLVFLVTYSELTYPYVLLSNLDNLLFFYIENNEILVFDLLSY